MVAAPPDKGLPVVRLLMLPFLLLVVAEAVAAHHKWVLKVIVLVVVTVEMVLVTIFRAHTHTMLVVAAADILERNPAAV